MLQKVRDLVARCATNFSRMPVSLAGNRQQPGGLLSLGFR